MKNVAIPRLLTILILVLGCQQTTLLGPEALPAAHDHSVKEDTTSIIPALPPDAKE